MRLIECLRVARKVSKMFPEGCKTGNEKAYAQRGSGRKLTMGMVLSVPFAEKISVLSSTKRIDLTSAPTAVLI